MMNHTHRLTALLGIALAVALAGCDPEDTPVTPQPQPQPEPETPVVDLTATSWQSDVENDYTLNYYGYRIQMVCNMLTFLDLNDDLNGELFTDISVEIPSMPSASQQQANSVTFTYTFDGTSLILTSLDSAATEGDYGTLTFHPDDTTFAMPLDDPEMSEMLGTDTLILHLIQGSINK